MKRRDKKITPYDWWDSHLLWYQKIYLHFITRKDRKRYLKFEEMYKKLNIK